MADRVIIVGAGIIGSSIAWRLSQLGIEVDLFDAGTLGGEASWAGAGMLAPGAEILEESAWSGLALESWRNYGEFVRELSAECGVPIDYRCCGGIELALDGREWSDLQDRAQRQKEWGIESRPLRPTELKAFVPSLSAPAVEGAMYYPGDAVVDPRHVTLALRQALGKRGVRIVENRAVRQIRNEARAVVVDDVTGSAAVVAAGAWSGSLAVPGFNIPASFPVRGHLAGYRLEPGLLGPILRHDHTYLVQRRSGLLIAGASKERVGFDRTIDPAAVAGMKAAAEALLGTMVKGREPEAWLGFRPATEALVPEVRQLPGAPIWVAYGHYRNGILMAPETARRVAGEIAASLGKR